MDKALKIYKRLIEKGEITDTEDKDIYYDFKNPEVREVLSFFERELDFKIVSAPHSAYLVPSVDNNVLCFKLKNIRKDGKQIDTFLICYIIMTILYMFYGGKNKNPKQADFLQVKDIVAKLDETLMKTKEDKGQEITNRYSINFMEIANYWRSKPLVDENRTRTKTRMDTVITTCSLLRDEKLLLLTDEDTEIRPTKKLDDLMEYYYLAEERIYEINDIFNGGEEDAEDK